MGTGMHWFGGWKWRRIYDRSPVLCTTCVKLQEAYYYVIMLEERDIQKLMEVLATKEDIRRVEDRVNAVESRLSAIEEIQSNLISVLDRISLRLDILHQEYLVLKERDTRYERWFKEIAEKVGITLVP